MLPGWINSFGLEPEKRKELALRLSIIGQNVRMLTARIRIAATSSDRVAIVKALSSAAESAALACYGIEYVCGMLEAQLARENRDNLRHSG